MKEKLILSNKSEIDIEIGSSLSDMKVLSKTKYDMISAWDMLTEENLKHIEILADDGTVVGIYDNILLDDETSTVRRDGTIITRFRLREKTEVELLRERVEQIENVQEIQDGAIMDLGEAVSMLSE